MKKFTVSLVTALVVCFVSAFGAFSISAEESGGDSEQIFISGGSVTMEELQQHMEEKGLVGDYKILSNEENKFFYYDQLDDNNKIVYNAMKEYWIEPDTSAVTVKFAEPFTFTANSSSISMWSNSTLDNYYYALYAAVQGGVNAFFFDYPEVFWFDPSGITFDPYYTSQRSFNIWGGRYTITVTQVTMHAQVQEVYGDIETAGMYANYLEECINNFNIEGDDRYSKLKSMYTQVAAAVTYNIDAPYHDTALGMFVEPFQIVCEGYSEAIKLLCDREGIPCVSIVGNYDESTKIAHMWNYVQMEDGKWYGLDCTWDDRDGEVPDITFDFFLKGSDSFLKKHYLNFGYIFMRFTYPELSTTDYVYQKPAETTPVVTDKPDVTTLATEVTSAATASHVTETTAASETKNTAVSTVTTTSAPTETSVSEPEQLKGDFNNDGEVTIADAVLLQKKLLGRIRVTAYDFMTELNDDGKIDIIDYIILMRIIR